MPIVKPRHADQQATKQYSTKNRQDAGSEPSLKPDGNSESAKKGATEPLDNNELQYIKGVGPKKATALAAAGFETFEDIVFHFPSRYLDAREVVPLVRIHDYLLKPVTVRAKIISTRFVRGQRKDRAIISLRDDSGGILQLVYFDFPEWRSKMFAVGDEVVAAGYPNSYQGSFQIVQPPFVETLEEIQGPSETAVTEGSIIPIYYISPALRKARIKDKLFREIVSQSLKATVDRGLLKEILPSEILSKEHWESRVESLKAIHQPNSISEALEARERIKFEEIFFLQLRLAIERRRSRSGKNFISFDTQSIRSALLAPESPDSRGLLESVVRSLPFRLTKAQEQVLHEIADDMSKVNDKHYAMNRLLQGDVGSGKTIVAILALLTAVENGYQGAFMAPTEVLAEQHYNTLRRVLADTIIQVSLLVGKQKRRERTELLEGLANGSTHIVVGTHALIEEGVQFDRLGLAITDEQHRFGVSQRKKLIDKAQIKMDPEMVKSTIAPDVLIMTATPIPRTLALMRYGDIDISSIRELPKGRAPIKTVLLYEHDHAVIYKALRKRIQQGEQAFIVYPLRDKSEKSDSQAAISAFESLKGNELKDLRLGLIHGLMPGTEKREVMRQFRNKEFDVLIATTVIEVGIDIPNATVMIVEHAERYGLSQLHQLRGRIGRGAKESACVLVASEKLFVRDGDMETSDNLEQRSLALERLDTLVRTSNGFEIAQVDLELRGAGEILGVRQSGRDALVLANLERDQRLLELALRYVRELLDSDPQLRESGHLAARSHFLKLYRDAESFLHVG